jgi:RNase adaptor protein for sRNA GlmZ degradation
MSSKKKKNLERTGWYRVPAIPARVDSDMATIREITTSTRLDFTIVIDVLKTRNLKERVSFSRG